MARSRFTPLEAIFAVLVAVGGVTAIAADRLGNETAKTVGLIGVVLGAIVFGLDMIVQRRAEIGTRYSSHVNPAFHVFRGVGAVAWGVVFIGAGVLFIAAAMSYLTTPTTAGGFVSEHAGLFVMLGGFVVTAWGIGSATGAVRRQGDAERPAKRVLDRLAAIVLIVPLGLAILGWGVLTTLAPSVADEAKSRVRSAAMQWFAGSVR
jgi:hypothetical protein